jgi:hypothetical protein
MKSQLRSGASHSTQHAEQKKLCTIASSINLNKTTADSQK